MTPALGAMKMKENKASRLTLRSPMLLVALVLMGLGVRGAYWVVIDDTRGFASRTWPSVSATILAGTLEESYGRGGREWAPNLTYSFSVDGKRYSGHYITFPPRRGSRASAEATLERYPVGQTVTAYYNPNDPAQACLEPGPDWWFLFIIPVVTVLLLAGSVWLGIMALRGMTPNKRIQTDAGCRPCG